MRPWLLIAIAFAIGLSGSWLYSNQLRIEEPVSSSALLPDSGCDLSKGRCQLSTTEGQRVSISLSPLPIPLMKPVELRLHAPGIASARSATVTIEGVNMFMGFQHSSLTPSGEYLIGQFSLPICSNSIMEWRASIEIRTDQQLLRASLPFTTEQ